MRHKIKKKTANKLSQAFGVAAIAPPPSPAPSSVVSTLAANWDVLHRFVGGAASQAMQGNTLVDFGTSSPVGNEVSGAYAAGDGSLAFSGVAPCVRFDGPLAPSSSQYSVVLRFVAPSVLVPHTTAVVWESSGSRHVLNWQIRYYGTLAEPAIYRRLFIATNDTRVQGTLGYYYGSNIVAAGGLVAPGAPVSLSIVCSGGACNMTRGL